MLYVRISLTTPKPKCEQQVAGLVDDLLSYYAKQPGYVSGFKLRSTADRLQLGRVTIWRSNEDADAAAQSAHVLARRSELLLLIEDEYDGTFDAAEAAESLAALVQGR